MEQCARQRRPLPKSIAEAPELDLGLEFYLTAFWELSSCRSIGFGFGPIPWTQIHDYARAHELDSDELEDFVYLIRAMDGAFIEYHIAEAAKNAPKTGSK